MKTRINLLVFFLFSFGTLQGQLLTLPIEVEPADFKSFKSTKDKLLTKALVDELKRNSKFQSLIRKKKLCFGVMDISDPANPRYASINGDHMMYAASLPKIAILLAVLDAVDKGEIQMTPDIEKDLHKMIRNSNNQSSTRMIDLVGYEKIAGTLQNPKYNLYDEDGAGGLWVGKRYAAAGKKYPEPIKGLSHAATVNQVCKFYYFMAYGQLINCERSEQMLEYMTDPAINHKFVNCLGKLCPDADIYRKSGTWRTYHSDSVLVIGKEWRSYILVALVDDSEGERIIRDLLPIVEKIIN